MYVFKCLLCGETCCTFINELEMPTIFPWEKRILEKHGSNLKFKPFIVYKINSNKYVVQLYRWIINGKCPFLTSDGKCSIHNDKPLACKMYPLIIGLEDNTLRVSGGCKVITEHREEITRSDPSKVFRNEYFYALKTYLLIKLLDEIANINSWEKKRIDQVGDAVFIDIDEIIEIDNLIKSIDEELYKNLNIKP